MNVVGTASTAQDDATESDGMESDTDAFEPTSGVELAKSDVATMASDGANPAVFMTVVEDKVIRTVRPVNLTGASSKNVAAKLSMPDGHHVAVLDVTV